MSTAYDVFISYARGDQERVRPWVEALKNGGTKVFFDTESIPGGADWLTAIANAIAEVKVLICFVSQQSTTSGFVSRETTLALERNKVILPVMLDQVELQGALSLSLSGKNRVEAFAWDLHKVWDVIESSLKPAGVEWRRPTGFLQGVQRTKQDLGPEPGNVRVKRPAPAVAEPPSVFSPAVVRGWLWSIATIVAICAGLWWDVPGMLSARMLVKDPPPVDTPQPLKAGSLENEAERLTEKFYLSVNGDPLGPLEFWPTRSTTVGMQVGHGRGWRKI